MTTNVDMQMRSPIAVAPMMDWTDRHCRYFMRLLSPGVRLYTEMITAAAIRHGDKKKLMRFDASEHPNAIQLGGSDPELMATAARDAAAAGYDEININVGCPSDRVQSGQFGACLMATPELVAESFRAMSAEVDVPITIKTRIGLDNDDSYEFLRRFIDPLVDAGCRTFVVHARIAILTGFSPKQNRTVPPLNYERVYRLKRDLPELEIVLNGGVSSGDQVAEILKHVDGVMIGRQAYHEPFFLAELDACFAGNSGLPDRREIVARMMPYIVKELAAGERLNRITRHMLGLFAGQPGARAWRRTISENAHQPNAGFEVLQKALAAVGTRHAGSNKAPAR